MEIVNRGLLINLNPKVVNIVDLIVDYYTKLGFDSKLVITSGARPDYYTEVTNSGKYIPSHHDERHDHSAVDFTLVNDEDKPVNLFSEVSFIFDQIKNLPELIEFEFCKDMTRQHIHIAVKNKASNETCLESFTGVYK